MDRLKRTIGGLILVSIVGTWALAETLSYISFRTNPNEQGIDQQLIDIYTEQTGNDVELSAINANDLRDAIRTYVASPNPPDVIFWFAGERTCFFADNGLLAPVTDVWEANGWEDVYPEAFQRLSQCSDGEYYFVPDSYYWWSVFYSKSVFESAGVEIPETFDELLGVCRDLNAAGIAPFTIANRDVWPASGVFDILNMRTNGPEYHLDLLNGRASYQDDEVASTFQNWADMMEAGCFVEDSTAYDLNDSIGLMVQGEAAMAVIGTFVMDFIPEASAGDIGFFRFPIVDPSLPVGEDAPTDGYIVPANAENLDAAKEFLTVLGSREGQEVIARLGGRLVPRSDVDPSIYTELLLEGQRFLEESDYAAQFYNRDTRSEMEAAFPLFVDLMLNPGDAERIQGDLQRLQERAFR